ncbi:hypothetical protein ACUHMQ_10125 [Chitinimonas sp. PSY-7]|uniref:hypothetical protein n=1 Tax=Chitinimonas sp. PSY-7 TaxID=3459088 RepID=UPI0040400D62
MPSFIAILLRLLPALCIALLTLLPAQAVTIRSSTPTNLKEANQACHTNESSTPSNSQKSKVHAKADCCSSDNPDCIAKCVSQNIKPTPLGLAFGIIPSRPGCQTPLLAESFDSTTLPQPERPPQLI